MIPANPLPVDVIDRLKTRDHRMIKAIVALAILMNVIVLVCALVSRGGFSGRQIGSMLYLAALAAGLAILYHWMMNRLIQQGELGQAKVENPTEFPFLCLFRHSLLEFVILKWLPINVVMFTYNGRKRPVFQLLFADEEIVCDEQGQALVVVDPAIGAFHRCLLTKSP